MTHRSSIPGASDLSGLPHPDTLGILGVTLLGGVLLIWVIVAWIGWLDVLEERRIERRRRMRRETP